jgi:hypothetical protein
MTIDDRIEALTRSVELLASFQRDIGQRMLELDQKWDQRMSKTGRRYDHVGRHCHRLALHQGP